MALMYFAAAIQEEGYLGEEARLAWKNAFEAWIDFGNHGIPSRLGYDVRLNELERLRETAKQARAELAELAPGVEEKLRQEKIAALPEPVREAVNTPADQRTAEQIRLASTAEAKDLAVRLNEIALGAPAEVRNRARRFAKQAYDAESAATVIERERDVVNFEYWMTRCESEQSEITASARQHLYAADRFFEDTDLEQARREYELAWQDWAEVYKRFPILMDDVEAEENYDAIKRYQRLLGQLDEPFPPPGFPLIQLLAYFDEEYENMVPGEVAPSTGEEPVDAIPPRVDAPSDDTPSTDPADAGEQETMEPAADAKPAAEAPEGGDSATEPKTDPESPPAPFQST